MCNVVKKNSEPGNLNKILKIPILLFTKTVPCGFAPQKTKNWPKTVFKLAKNWPDHCSFFNEIEPCCPKCAVYQRVMMTIAMTMTALIGS